MPSKPGRQQGVRRHQRWGQTALDLGRTLDPKFSIPIEDEEDTSWIGTCGRCGRYLDVRQHPTCPAPCGGYVG